MKIFLWNLWLKLHLWYLIKFKVKKIKYYKRWDPKREEWEFTLRDEFENYEINKNIWRTDSYNGMRYSTDLIEKNQCPIEWYSDGCFDFTQTTAKLKSVKVAKRIVHEGKELSIPFQIGQIDSSATFMQTYGLFEIRARIPKSPGMRPLFQLKSIMSDYSQINICEVYTSKKNGICKFKTGAYWSKGKRQRRQATYHKAFDLSKHFFIYSVDWSEKLLKFYFQDQLIKVMKTPKSYIHPMYIVISNSVDSNNLENTEFPNYCEIDYVRVYQRKK